MKKMQRFITAIAGIRHNSAEYGTKGITKNHPYKKSALLAAFLSLLVCSSSGAENTNVPNNTNTTPNNTNLAASNSFFPFGFYHVSWEATPEQRMNDLRTMAAAGFNVIHASIKGPEDFDEYGKFLDEAQKLGVRVISEFNSPDKSSAVKRFKNKPAVLGWSIADDAGIDTSVSCDNILNLHNNVKTVDPSHLTYISVAKVKDYKNYNYCSDIIGAQDYPVPKETTSSDLLEVDYVMNIATREAAKFNRPVFANLQAFSWDGGRAPSAKEVRSMTYQALINGVKGIMYYTFHDTTWNLTDHTSLWKGMKALTPEIKQLTPMLLNGNLTKVSSGMEDLYVGLWKYQNQSVVVVINTSYDTTKDVSIQLPLQNVRNLISTFASRPSGMVIKNGVLSGSINPLDVHVYTLK